MATVLQNMATLPRPKYTHQKAHSFSSSAGAANIAIGQASTCPTGLINYST